MKESPIQTAILNALNYLPDTFAFKVHTTGIPIGRTGFFRTNPNKGTADILVCKDGRFAAFEVKRPGEKAEPHQAQWGQKVTQWGKGKYFVVHSVEEAEAAWRTV